MPAIYVHSLFGSRSDLAGMEGSGIARRVNRAVLDADSLDEELAAVSVPWAPQVRDLLDGSTGEDTTELDGYAVRWLAE